MSGRSLARSWLERDLRHGDLSFLTDFALFKNRYPPSAVVDRLCERGFMVRPRPGRRRMTLRGWMAVVLRHTFVRAQSETSDA